MRKEPASIERVQPRMVVLRGLKVMLTSDVARLYEVEPRALIRAVKRNAERFPSDFMFRLTWADLAHLSAQAVTLRCSRGVKYAPYAFTVPGVAILASVLRSERAVQVHIALIRAFVRLRATASSYRDLANKLHALEQKYDAKCQTVFDAIRELTEPPDPSPETPKPSIGFRPA